MIEVQGLCKDFAGGVHALRDVSFTARPGGVLGFLGPNGAGKTTTMRILAGYLRPSAGAARICGHDVATDSLASRRCLGYLPEQVPLYGEMRVSEYLRYRAELRQLARGERRSAIGEALELAGLVEQQERIIGQLSKGYRQRVGLADALLHRPPALVLDEPTDGLDPNQRREVLGVIARLGRERAVVLSTHVLPEVDAVCREVVIIDRGRVVAAGEAAALAERLADRTLVELRCRGPLPVLRAALLAVPGVAEVTIAGAGAGATGAGEAGAGEAGGHAAAAGATTAAAAGAGATAAGDGPYELRVRLTEARAADPGRCREELARAVLSAGELQELRPARSGLEAVFRWLTAETGGAP